MTIAQSVQDKILRDNTDEGPTSDTRCEMLEDKRWVQRVGLRQSVGICTDDDCTSDKRLLTGAVVCAPSATLAHSGA